MRAVDQIAIVALTMLVFHPSALGRSSFEGSVSQQLKGTTLTLRRPYEGNELKFDAMGRVVGDISIGPWTTCSQVRVNRVRVSSATLRIEGRRVNLFFDPIGKRFRDVASVQKNEPAAAMFHVRKGEGLPGDPVRIEVSLPKVEVSLDKLMATLHLVFLEPHESPAATAAPYWQRFFAQQEGRAFTSSETEGIEVYEARSGNGILMPHATYSPDPEYSEDARRAGFHGSLTLSLVVDTDGKPRDIQIATPAGLGLDEKSVGAAKAWTFEPGQKNGKAVNVRINIEMTFSLY